jgi:hypothetical protein
MKKGTRTIIILRVDIVHTLAGSQGYNGMEKRKTYP